MEEKECQTKTKAIPGGFSVFERPVRSVRRVFPSFSHVTAQSVNPSSQISTQTSYGFNVIFYGWVYTGGTRRNGYGAA